MSKLITKIYYDNDTCVVLYEDVKEGTKFEIRMAKGFTKLDFYIHRFLYFYKKAINLIFYKWVEFLVNSFLLWRIGKRNHE